MKTVKAVELLSGVSIRTLHYYDAIGLLHPTKITDAGYRLYDDSALARLQSILLFRELRFPLKDIAAILDSPAFDCDAALCQQIELLELQRQRLGQLIDLARTIQHKGGNHMDFKAFDDSKIKAYEQQAKERWGQTAAWQEYEKTPTAQSTDEAKSAAEGLMEQFRLFGALRGKSPADSEVQQRVKALQDYISAHFYTCTPEILSGLGQMYVAGGEMTDNIDACGGEGTAALCAAAIEAYCSK